MSSDVLGKISHDLLSVPPLIFRIIRRRLVTTTLADTDGEIKLLHFEILKVLEDEGTMHPAKIGEKLVIAKAQMTHLIDKLVEMDYVKREMDSIDRRTINITLTAKGKTFVDGRDSLVVGAVRDNMSALSGQEVEALSGSLRTLRDILSKLQH